MKRTLPSGCWRRTTPPDFRTISDFRKDHLQSLAGLFVQVLRVCRKAGLVKLGHVAIDGTKVKANASKHKAMSYKRMKEEEARLEAEVRELLQKAQSTDEAEDRAYGKNKRGDELPKELSFRESRLQKIREAEAALEAESMVEAEEKQDKSDKGTEAPDGKAQRNKKQAVPMVKQVKENTGDLPRQMSADAGYFSSNVVGELTASGIDVYIPPDKMRHAYKMPAAPRGRIPKGLSTADRMRRKLKTKLGRKRYGLRKELPEPVFGQIKQARGFRQFLLRGKEKVRAEWRFICTGHNVLKLFSALTSVLAELAAADECRHLSAA